MGAIQFQGFLVVSFLFLISLAQPLWANESSSFLIDEIFVEGERHFLVDNNQVKACSGLQGVETNTLELVRGESASFLLESARSNEGDFTTLLNLQTGKCLELNREFYGYIYPKIDGNRLFLTAYVDFLMGNPKLFLVDLGKLEAIPVIQYQNDAYSVEYFNKGSGSFFGTLVTRLRDFKSLKIRGQVPSLLEQVISQAPTVSQEGILTIWDIPKKVDLARFDDEIRFFSKVGGNVAVVMNESDAVVDTADELRKSYRDLVWASQKFPERFTEKADPDLMKKLAESIRLRRSAVVLGKAGVGKTSAIRAFAREVGKGNIPRVPRTLQIYEIKVANLASGTKFVGSIEKRIATLISGAQKTGGILFFDELHSLAGVGTSSFQSNDVTQMMKGPIENREVVILATDTSHDFNNLFAKDPAFMERFEQLTAPVPEGQSLIDVIRARMSQEGEAGQQLTDSFIQEAIRLSNEYDMLASQPRAAVNLLVKAIARIENEGEFGSWSEGLLREVATDKYGFDPALFQRNTTLERLETLTKGMDLELIGQADAKKAVQAMWRRRLARVGDSQQVNSILFVGPPGVGKSRLGEISAQLMGYEKTVLEMNKFRRGEVEEFRNEIYSALLIHPFRVFVLDEFEKAHISVQDAALSMLQSGEFTMVEKRLGGGTFNREVSAKHAVFILTSNAGEVLIDQRTHSGDPIEPRELVAHLEADGISPAILSRIIKIVPMFRPSRDEFLKGIHFYLEKTLDREGDSHHVKFHLKNKDDFVTAMMEGYSESVDYRDIKKMMVELEDTISLAVLENDLEKGQGVALIWIEEKNSPVSKKRRWEPWMGMYN